MIHTVTAELYLMKEKAAMRALGVCRDTVLSRHSVCLQAHTEFI